jgi:hypothetical protein
MQKAFKIKVSTDDSNWFGVTLPQIVKLLLLSINY